MSSSHGSSEGEDAASSASSEHEVEEKHEEGSIVLTTTGRTSDKDAAPRVVVIAGDSATNNYCNNYVRTSKYTWYSFIPKNLIEQFTRVANIYFLVISGFQQIPGLSPTGQWTTLGPLIVVLSFTALKEAIEDLRRHKQDHEVNGRKVKVLQGKTLVNIAWEDVLVGNIVKVKNRDYIPADLVLLSSSEPEGVCYIETANLDGETNLKIRQAIPETQDLVDLESLQKLNGCILKCEQPNERLYTFDGSIEYRKKTLPLEAKQVLLRGAMLRNTKWIYGVAIYTGHESKLMKNAKEAPRKKTNVERALNIQLVFMFVLLLVLAIVSSIGFGIWQADYNSTAWYLQFGDSAAAGAALSVITFIILYNNLIPISLYVSVEMVKFGQAYFINNDVQMYWAENDTPALARTSNLNEELGQVQYIFSDKTGTLTCNKMEFKKCSIAGIIYGETVEIATNNIPLSMASDSVELEALPNDIEWSDPTLERNLKDHETKDVMAQAFVLLSTCHTVIPEADKKGNITYQASSPDESALVKAAKKFGFYFHIRGPKSVTVEVMGKDVEYQILNTLEFNNTRKRMSVIVKTPEGKIILFCKGADNVIYERLAKTQPYADVTRTHLDKFASEGLRTLCLSMVELDPKEYAKWSITFEAASTQIGNREEALADAAEEIEKELILLGASAVEDKLQSGVPEAIATLAKAGIKIWVLTGDKQETAINIGHSCQLLVHEMEILVVNEETMETTEERIEQLLTDYSHIVDTSETLALVIDGATLNFALKDSLKERLLNLAVKCKAVICCRVSPLQKALVVRLVREKLNSITLAIGDGANDVSMIQEAHVGVGISGEEGLQAARSSDYAIAQFRFLTRLLLVHGRWSYRRTSKVILYSFYKNNLLQFTQFWYNFFNGFSGQTLYERWTLASYNVFFTLFLILFFGLQDRDVSDDQLLEYPQLYTSGQNKFHFNFRRFWGWVANAIFHSFIIFAICTLATQHGTVHAGGEVVGLWATGTLMYTAVVLVVSLKVGLEARTWTGPFQVALGGSLLIWVLWMLIYGVFYGSGISLGTDFFYVPYNILNSAAYYFTIILVAIATLWRDVVWKYVYRTYFPQDYHIIQEKEKMPKLVSLALP